MLKGFFVDINSFPRVSEKGHASLKTFVVGKRNFYIQIYTNQGDRQDNQNSECR